MKSFLCRVIAVIFLFNCLAPTGWGQARRSSVSLERQLSSKIQQAKESNAPATQFAQADTAARKAHKEHFFQADSTVKALQQQAKLSPRAQAPSSTRVDRPLATIPFPSYIKNFLHQVEQGKINFEDLIEYADPLDPDIEKNNLSMITYAAEIMGNNIGQMAQLDSSQYDTAQMQQLLTQIEARLAYRLSFLGSKVPSYIANPSKTQASQARAALQQQYGPSIQRTMAVGTLRMTLLKIHQFFKAQNLPDPIEEYQKQKLAEQISPSISQKKGIENQQFLRVFLPQEQESVQEIVPKWVAQYGNLAKFQQEFIDELRQAVAKKPDQGTTDYQHLQVLAEYATAYALEYKPEAIKEIVKIFDEGVKHNFKGNVKAGDFHRTYTPILDAIFNTVLEDTRYSTMDEEQTKKVLTLLKDFSDPEQYSLPTRVFALETASALYRPFNEATLRQIGQQSIKTFLPVNFNKPDESLRSVFAKRVTDIYCPLTSHFYQDYGLSAQEMQALADKLAYIYDGFYDISTPTIHMPGQDPHHYPAQCKMVMKNEPNRKKKDDVMRADIFEFTGEVIFWTYGGELFSLVGTAYRLTRGAVAAMPKAYKAFKSAEALSAAKAMRFNQALQRGRTGLKLAGQEIRDGAKLQNWLSKINREGYQVMMTVETEASNVVQEVGATGAKTAKATVTEEKVISSTRQLQGKPSRWQRLKNWWTGTQPEQNFTGMRVVKTEPNFQVTVAEATFERPVSGLRSMSDINNAWAQLRLPDGSAFPYVPKPYWQSIWDATQVSVERSLFDGVGKSLGNNVDSWIPLIPRVSRGPRITGTVGKAMEEKIYWWNMTRWGIPPQGYQASEWTRIFVAPSGKFSTIKAAAQLQAEGGLLNAPSKLPGFFVTGFDGITGNLEKEIFNAFFKPMNWKNGFARTFLPDYVPTSMFWKFVQTNPIIGMQLGPRLLWRNRFSATTQFFAAWMGVEYGIYPFYKGWIEKEATQEANQEIAKYGDTFSKKRAKQDEFMYQNLGVNLPAIPEKSTLEAVLDAQPDQTNGILLAAPIIAARHALGKTVLGKESGLGLPFFNEGAQADLAVKAHKADLSHATLIKAYNQVKANEKATEEWKKEQRAAIEQEKQAVLTAYAEGFQAQPQLKKEVDRIYQTFADKFLNSQTQEEAMQANAWFETQIAPVITQVEAYLQAVQTSSLLEEAEKLAQGEIAKMKSWYGDLVTSDIEKKVYRIWSSYARAIGAALQSADPDGEKSKEAIQEKDAKIQTVYDELYKMRFGSNFDPHAADKLEPVQATEQ